MGEDFPFVCDKCLGDNKFMRMIKMPNHDACKLTKKPFTVFRWRPSRKSPVYHRTLCSYEIAAEKNICQCCLTDLTYGVHVSLKDQFMSSQATHVSQRMGGVPMSETNQSYYFQQKLANRDNKLFIRDATLEKGPSDHLAELADEFKSRQNAQHNEEQEDIKQVKRKKAKRKAAYQNLLKDAPEDETITTLFLSNIPDKTTEGEIKSLLEVYGIIERVYMLVEKNSCFVEFKTREEAEIAAMNMEKNFTIEGKRINVSWAFTHDPYHEHGKEKMRLAEIFKAEKEKLANQIVDDGEANKMQNPFSKSALKNTLLGKLIYKDDHQSSSQEKTAVIKINFTKQKKNKAIKLNPSLKSVLNRKEVKIDMEKLISVMESK